MIPDSQRRLSIRKMCAILITVSSLLVACGTSSSEKALRFYFFDAGEGDATLIEFPDSKYVLVDTGNPLSAYRILEYLDRKKINVIDRIFITHPHPDHFGGIFAVAQRISFKHIHDNGHTIQKTPKESPFLRWYECVARKGGAYSPAREGMSIPFGEARLAVLWPHGAFKNNDRNALSLVMKIEYGKFRCLLMGDANTIVEEELLKRELPGAQVLRAGHHGAGDTASAKFIERITPEIVIVSVDKNNINGYPSKDALKRYEKSGARVYRTDEYGTVVIEGYANGRLIVKTEKNNSPL